MQPLSGQGSYHSLSALHMGSESAQNLYGPTLSVVGYRSGVKGTETHNHAMTAKATSLKTSVFIQK